VRLSAQPPSARFTLDGAALATNPYEADVPSDSLVHRIAATADGFEPRQLQATFDRDVVLDVALAASAAVATSPVVTSAASHMKHAQFGSPPRPAPPSAQTPKSQRAIEEEDPYKK
jgi:hypothetical protein